MIEGSCCCCTYMLCLANTKWHHDRAVCFGVHADFERISLNAMEERVLPPDVRIKIVCAQASAVEQEEEQLEAEVSTDLNHPFFEL